MKKKKQGCEIEATNVCFKIPATKSAARLKIWSKADEQEDSNGGDDVKGGSTMRYVLKDCTVRAKPGELLAVVGPSGAGKSTLLQILAGRLDPSPPSSPMLVDGKPVNKSGFKKMSGYVAQHDALFPLLTVRETLFFSAKLRLRLPDAELYSIVEELIEELGLLAVADSRVGDGKKVRGLSGGERRRVSIGVEVVHEPRVLVLDEPTSGLDSNSALQIVDMLKTMTEKSGRTVVLSIHQPGYRIVNLFSSLILLAAGNVIHSGTVDQLHLRLVTAGLHLPLHTNVVEFAIDSIDSLQPQQEMMIRCSKKKSSSLKQIYQFPKYVDIDDSFAYSFAGSFAGTWVDDDDYANSWVAETAILANRFSKTVVRTSQLFTCRTVQMLTSGFILGSIFFNLSGDPGGAREKVGLFAFILTFLLSTTTEALPIFLLEREILMRETSCGSYRVSSYAVANGIVFLPFLLALAALFSAPLYWLVGLHRTASAFSYFLLLIWLILITANSVAACFAALAPDFIVGNAVISGVMGSFFLFSGYFISKQAMPGYCVFMHYLSLFRYPFEGFLVNEFSGQCLETADGVCLIAGDDILRQEGLGDDSRWRNVAVMVCFILAYRTIGYLILRCKCHVARNGGGVKSRTLV